MSRLGKAPIEVPKGIELKITKTQIEAKGAKGLMSQTFPEGVELKQEGELLFVTVDEKRGLNSAIHGL